MINIQRFICNAFQENCYVVSDETDEAVIVDCGAFYEEERQAVVQYITDKNLKPVKLIVTHAHIDHNFGNDTIFANYGLKPEMSARDKFLYDQLKDQAMLFCGIEYTKSIIPIGRFFEIDDKIQFGSHTFTIIPTPGHTPGGVIYYCEPERIAFSGDTLFRFSIGRTDFEGGSYDDIIKSLTHITKILPPDTIILTGHGDRTTIKDEIKMNPYLR
jgi:hydroxyacylglutathione hydrolase